MTPNHENTDNETTLWCPRCAEATSHVPIPQMAGDDDLIGQLSYSADPAGFFRRHYCQQCRGIWRSVQLPLGFVEELLSSRRKIDDHKREIAMLRFMLASQKAAGAEDEEQVA